MADYLHGAYGHLDESVVQGTVASETVPVYFGTAPVGLVRGWEDMDAVNAPVKISSLADARAKIGHSEDFASYTLCEAVAAHFDAGVEGVGPIYVVNVLDPAVHKKASPTARTAVLTAGRASFATDTVILDTLRVERPAVEGAAQDMEVRADGPAGDEPGFGYAAAYKAAGVTFSDGVITYEPAGAIAPELYHGDHAYIGIAFPAPEGATACDLTVGAGSPVHVDLSTDGDNCFAGDPLEYFAFADAEGAALAPASWEVRLAWTGGSADGTETACRVSRGTDAYVEGTDYTLDYNANTGSVVLSSIDGRVPDGPVTVAYTEMDPAAVTADDVVGMATADGRYSGIAALQLLYQEQYVVPNLLAAPGWSHVKRVYDALVSASSKVNGHWDAFVAADLPLVDEDAEMVDTIAKAVAWKAEHGYTSERSVVCWPMATDAGGRRFHVSTLWCAESLRVDQSHRGVPFEVPSNKETQVTRQFFGDNAVNRGFDQVTANQLNEHGIVTVIAWAGAWLLWGPHTAAYEHGNPSVDPRSYFSNNMRTLFHITNSFQQEWAPQVDQPMTRALRDRIVNREQEKLDALVTQGALIGAPRISFIESENPTSQLMEGDFRWDAEATPTPPMKSASVYLRYTDDGFESYFEGSE